MSDDTTTMLRLLFEHAGQDELINFRMVRQDGAVVEAFLPAVDIAAATEWALKRRAQGDIYVGVLPRCATAAAATRSVRRVWSGLIATPPKRSPPSKPSR